ncbi:unnamed protein product, partial [Ectocarpus sp. 8 AP-2014]
MVVARVFSLLGTFPFACLLSTSFEAVVFAVKETSVAGTATLEHGQKKESTVVQEANTPSLYYSLQGYLSIMAQPSAYGGYIEIAAASQLYGLTIDVVIAGTPFPPPPHPPQ